MLAVNCSVVLDLYPIESEGSNRIRIFNPAWDPKFEKNYNTKISELSSKTGNNRKQILANESENEKFDWNNERKKTVAILRNVHLKENYFWKITELNLTRCKWHEDLHLLNLCNAIMCKFIFSTYKTCE